MSEFTESELGAVLHQGASEMERLLEVLSEHIVPTVGTWAALVQVAAFAGITSIRPAVTREQWLKLCEVVYDSAATFAEMEIPQ